MSAEASTSQQESFVGQMLGGLAILTTADRIGPSEYHHFMCIFRPVCVVVTCVISVDLWRFHMSRFGKTFLYHVHHTQIPIPHVVAIER